MWQCDTLFSVLRHGTQLWCCYLDWRHAPGDPGSVVWWCGRWVRSVRCPGRWPTAAGLSASLLSFHPAPGLYSPPLREGDGPLDERRRRRRRLGAEEEKRESSELWFICTTMMASFKFMETIHPNGDKNIKSQGDLILEKKKTKAL